MKIIPNAFAEKPVLKLMFGAMISAGECRRAIKVTDFERRQMLVPAGRRELEHEHKARNGLGNRTSKKESTAKSSSSSQT